MNEDIRKSLAKISLNATTLQTALWAPLNDPGLTQTDLDDLANTLNRILVRLDIHYNALLAALEE